MSSGDSFGSGSPPHRDGDPITESPDLDHGEDWWLASDGEWYPPETHPSRQVSSPGGKPPQIARAHLWGAKPYRSPARLGRTLQIAVLLLVILGAIVIGSSVVEYLLLDRLADDPLTVTVADLEAAADRQSVLAWAQVAGLVIVAIVLIAWTNRLYLNLPALGVEPRFALGWAIGGWFVPIMNFWRPKQVIDDIWRGTAPDHSTRGSKTAVSPLLHVWWAVWLFGLLFDQIVSARDDTALESLPTNALLSIVSDTILVLGAILLFWVVTRLTRRQESAASPVAHAGVAPAAFSAEMMEHPTLVRRTRAMPKWLAVATLPIAAAVVATSTTLVWDPGGSDGGSDPSGTGESGVGTLTQNLKTGDCYNWPDDFDEPRQVLAVEVVPCDTPHQSEVAGTTRVAFPSESSPDDDEVIFRATVRCTEFFERFVGASWHESGMGVRVITPSPDKWEAGDREFLCTAENISGEPVQGSVQGIHTILDSGETSIFNLSEGDCFDDSKSNSSIVVQFVACEAAHDNEVFAVIDFPAAPDAVYPGDDELEAFANQTKADEFERRVDPESGEGLNHFAVYATRYGWELGTRSVIFILTDRTGAKIEGSMLRN